MAQQFIQLGTIPNDGTGDALRDGGDKINDNFDELYPAVALNTAKVTNANHTGDATGTAALTLATVNASPGTYTQATITVNGKGLVTAAASGIGSVINKYTGTVTLNASVLTQKTTTVQTIPYSIMFIDSDNYCHAPEEFATYLTTAGGFYILNMYSDEAIDLNIYILY